MNRVFKDESELEIYDYFDNEIKRPPGQILSD